MRDRPCFSPSVWLGFPVVIALLPAIWLVTGGRAFGAEGVGVVKGVVVDEGGRPVAGARVWALRLTYYEPVDPFKPTLDVATDAEGRFEAQLPPGEYAAGAAKGLLTAENAPWRVRRWDVEPAKTLDLRIPLGKGGRVEGIVVRKADGKPVASAKLVLSSGLVATADGQGRFAFDGVGRDRGLLRAVAPGLADTEVKLDEAPKGALRIKMPQGFTVQGRVTDEAGRPVPGARVGRPAYTLVHSRMRSCLTDAEGKYALAGYPREGEPASLAVMHRDFATPRMEVPPPKEGDVRVLDVKLGKGYAIEGEVRGPDGKPVRGAEIEFGMPLDPHNSTRTDEKGFFRLDCLASDAEAEISVEVKGSPPISEKVRPGQGASVPKLSFAMAQGKVAVGRVTDPKGRPVAGAVVYGKVPTPHG